MHGYTHGVPVSANSLLKIVLQIARRQATERLKLHVDKKLYTKLIMA
jgi:hypothetical protein